MRTQSVEGYYPLISKSPHPITRIPPFLKVSHLLTLLATWSSHVFRINKNATVKLGSVNAICVKQQHNIGFFIFKSTLKYMLGNVYINEINAIYIYIYIYIIMKTMCPSGFHLNGFVVTPALGHMMHMRCYKSIVVTTEKHTVFITYILCPSCFFEI